MLDNCEVIEGVCQACGPVASPNCGIACVCACHHEASGASRRAHNGEDYTMTVQPFTWETTNDTEGRD